MKRLLRLLALGTILSLLVGALVSPAVVYGVDDPPPENPPDEVVADQGHESSCLAQDTALHDSGVDLNSDPWEGLHARVLAECADVLPPHPV